ncbi:MAG TPA: hypothetical protein DCW68_07645 [Rhodospirillaceae bacterium]|nr:MAG: hypothetical protein A2018_08135 [Alphaproteobacteria bacterium GWF2_58_20]HAU29960.1 hypothetical protein [Rhodospirillaceae bacterium]
MQASTPRKTVTPAEAVAWFEYFARSEELALGVTNTCCDCRAHVKSIQMVEQGIDTRQAWLIKKHEGNETMEFNLHVAPCLMTTWPDGRIVPLVIDPAHCPFPVQPKIWANFFHARNPVIIDVNNAFTSQDPNADFSGLYEELGENLLFNKASWDERAFRLLNEARQREKRLGLEPAPWIQKLRKTAPKPSPFSRTDMP